MWNFKVKTSFSVLFLLYRFIYEIIEGKGFVTTTQARLCKFDLEILIYLCLFYFSV